MTAPGPNVATPSPTVTSSIDRRSRWIESALMPLHLPGGSSRRRRDARDAAATPATPPRLPRRRRDSRDSAATPATPDAGRARVAVPAGPVRERHRVLARGRDGGRDVAGVARPQHASRQDAVANLVAPVVRVRRDVARDVARDSSCEVSACCGTGVGGSRQQQSCNAHRPRMRVGQPHRTARLGPEAVDARPGCPRESERGANSNPAQMGIECVTLDPASVGEPINNNPEAVRDQVARILLNGRQIFLGVWTTSANAYAARDDGLQRTVAHIAAARRAVRRCAPS